MNGIIGHSMGSLRLLETYDRSKTQGLCVAVAKETKTMVFCDSVVRDC
jgi:hypothetical protein